MNGNFSQALANSQIIDMDSVQHQQEDAKRKYEVVEKSPSISLWMKIGLGGLLLFFACVFIIRSINIAKRKRKQLNKNVINTKPIAENNFSQKTSINETNEPLKKLGEILKERRIKAGITIDDVTKMTSIKSEFITKIEQGSYSSFSEKAYIKGIVLSYLKIINSEDLIDEFTKQIDQLKEKETTSAQSKPSVKVKVRVKPSRSYTEIPTTPQDRLASAMSSYQEFSKYTKRRTTMRRRHTLRKILYTLGVVIVLFALWFYYLR